jgi:hypothetical protein
MLLILRALLALASGFFFILVVGVSLAAFLVLTGEPEPCVDREVQPAPPASLELQRNWLEMRDAVARGETIRVSVTELQATSIGAEYVRDHGVEVDDFVVHFCPDLTAEASGRIGLLGLSSSILVKGRLDVSGERPRVRLDTLRAGRFPDFLARPVVQLLLDDSEIRTLDLLDNIADVEYRDGEVVVTVQPAAMSQGTGN